jgi:hypothetical protein
MSALVAPSAARVGELERPQSPVHLSHAVS